MQKRFASDEAATKKPEEERISESAAEAQASAGKSSLAGTESAEPAHVVEEVVAKVGKCNWMYQDVSKLIGYSPQDGSSRRECSSGYQYVLDNFS
jgi:hypothetical protein